MFLKIKTKENWLKIKKQKYVTGVLDYDKTIRNHKCLIAFQILYQMFNVPWRLK